MSPAATAYRRVLDAVRRRPQACSRCGEHPVWEGCENGLCLGCHTDDLVKQAWGWSDERIAAARAEVEADEQLAGELGRRAER